MVLSSKILGDTQSVKMRAEKKKQLKFIVNPFAGVGNKKNFQGLLAKHLDHQAFEYQVEYTQAPGHGKEIATKALQEGFDIIVAVGGDGKVAGEGRVAFPPP